jgi:hypothetical protein
MLVEVEVVPMAWEVLLEEMVVVEQVDIMFHPLLQELQEPQD